MVFLIFGMGAGVYFTMNYYNAVTNNNAMASHKSLPAPAIASGSQVALAKNRDSALSDKKDSLKQKETIPFVNHPRPDAPQQGIVTVDLKKE